MYSPALTPLILQFRFASVSVASLRRKARLLGLCLSAIGCLIACDGGSNDAITAELSEGELSLSLPDRIQNISAINPNAVSAIATVNNQQFPLTLTNDGTYQTSITVSAETPVSISLSFSETLPGGAVIDLASHPAIESNTGSNDLTLQFFDANYETDQFDIDGDGCSNIIEREAETNPLVDDAIAQNFVRSVNFILPSSISSLPDQLLFGPIVTIGGRPSLPNIIGNSVQVTGEPLAQCSNSEIQVLLRIFVNGSSLVLAQASIPHGTNANTVLAGSDFNFNEDADGDGLTNLTEVQNGTDPFISN